MQVRILGCLIEKERTTPDNYPLTMNGLLSACNQTTNRYPVVTFTEATVSNAILNLRSEDLLRIDYSRSNRADKYRQVLDEALEADDAEISLLAVLMLRGPQTAGELRLNCERLQRFADISSVEGFLHELAEWPAGALVTELPRQPGSRENRWAHLLSGTPAIAAFTADALPTGTNNKADGDAMAALRDRVGQLENDVAALKENLARLRADGASSD
ncbi:MAG: YceH family protein [Pseudonocardiaceae bacterium]